jgi:hypothetical protein
VLLLMASSSDMSLDLSMNLRFDESLEFHLDHNPLI